MPTPDLSQRQLRILDYIRYMPRHDTTRRPTCARIARAVHHTHATILTELLELHKLGLVLMDRPARSYMMARYDVTPEGVKVSARSRLT